MRLAGFVLAGGASRRMGRDKALLPYQGHPLAAAAATTLSHIANLVTIIGDPARYGDFGYRAIADAVPACGPAGGILTALLQNQADWNLVVACDMPGITVELLATLAGQTGAATGDCIVPLGADGQAEPLCAIYHARCRPLLEQAICENRLRMRDLVMELRPVFVSGIDPLHLTNVNTPADWRTWELTR